jgi:hypothetical protein
MIGGGGKSGKSGGRDKRLAAALRENLRRRKTQARGRGAQPEPGLRAKPPPRKGESR